MRMFRIITSFIVLLLLATILASCKDNEIVTTEGIIFEKVSGKDEYAVIGYTGISNDIVIAETHNNLPVTKVCVDAFRDLDIEILSINLPDSIVELERFSLETLRITQFHIPKNLKYFAQAFGTYNKNILFIIPTDHQYLKDSLIHGHQIIVTKDEKELIYVYDTENDNEILTIPNTFTSIGHSALAFTHFTEIIIPDSIETIESYAFYNNRNTNVNIPTSIIRIGQNAYSLTNPPSDLQLPNGLEIIEAGAFYESKITRVELPSTIIYLHYTAFGNSNNNLAMHNKITYLKFMSFNLTGNNLTDFTNMFVFSTFWQNYHPSCNIEIELPTNQLESVQLQNALEASLVIASTVSSNVFPEITFTYLP
jgi:hypothetical protein